MQTPDTRRASPFAEPRRLQLVARIALAAVLVALGMWTIHRFLPAIVWAGIFAIALWPLYQKAQRRWPPGRHNVLLPAIFTVAVALVFLVPLALLAVQAGREAHGLLQWFHDAQRTGLPVPDWLAKLPVGSEQATAWWRENLANPAGASDLLGRLNREELVSYTRQFGSQLAHRTILFFFTLLTLFFLFRDGAALSAQMLSASQRAFGPHGERIARQMVASVHGTLDGLVLVGLGEGVLLGIAYALTGVPHPTLLGALTAVAAMIPFGAPLVFGIAALLLLTQGSVAAAAVVFAFGMAVLAIADHVIRPALIGGATRLPFLWVLFGILGGVETWGLLGLFLGPAIMAALILLWREYVGLRARSGDG